MPGLRAGLLFMWSQPKLLSDLCEVVGRETLFQQLTNGRRSVRQAHAVLKSINRGYSVGRDREGNDLQTLLGFSFPTLTICLGCGPPLRFLPRLPIGGGFGFQFKGGTR
jgi:hypothetical protein